MAKAKRSKRKRDFSLVHPHAAAIDIGATMHMAAVGPDCGPDPVRSFGTFTGDLHRLADWFAGCGVKTVAMESTGVYWIPAFETLDQRGFDVVLVNARDAKHVPGRKTDVSDAQWLQRLHSFGLLRGSFQPRGEIAVLRAYPRQRERLLEYGAAHIQHMQKALTQMNLQIHHVVADITGATGMRVVRAIVAGERDPAVLASCHDPRCHASEETIRAVLHALLGIDLSAWPSAKHFTSWLSLSPSNKISRGRVLSSRARRSEPDGGGIAARRSHRRAHRNGIGRFLPSPLCAHR